MKFFLMVIVVGCSSMGCSFFSKTKLAANAPSGQTGPGSICYKALQADGSQFKTPVCALTEDAASGLAMDLREKCGTICTICKVEAVTK